MRLRLLSEDDMPDLMALKEAAGWNQTEEDWRMYLAWDPNGCFGIEVDGRIVSSAISVCYGGKLAWIAMVLTLPEYRGQGYARTLTRRAVEYAGTRAVRLDASDMGRPLYESLGFVPECAVERWCRPPAAYAPAPPVGPISYDVQLDAEIFGADRSALLRQLERDEAASVPGAYAFGRRRSQGPYFGPCVSSTPQGALELLRWFVSLYSTESVYTDLFPHNQAAAANAGSLGFAPARRLTRMVRKPAAPSLPDVRIYATASFSWG